MSGSSYNLARELSSEIAVEFFRNYSYQIDRVIGFFVVY